MKCIKIILPVFLLCTAQVLYAQNEDPACAFINEGLPAIEFGKSHWGVFLLNKPVYPDAVSAAKILESSSGTVPPATRQELYEGLLQLNQKDAPVQKWQQARLKNWVLVADTKTRISLAAADSLLDKNKNHAQVRRWIDTWNKTKIKNRLVNFMSIPIFSKDGNYVMIYRGQHMQGQGWDCIYIYHAVNTSWELADKIVLSQI